MPTSGCPHAFGGQVLSTHLGRSCPQAASVTRLPSRCCGLKIQRQDTSLEIRRPHAELSTSSELSTANLARLDEVAGSSPDELTEYRRSSSAALGAQREGASREPLCDRFRRKEIPDLHSQRR